MTTTEHTPNKPAQRPEILTTLCILTFIGSGMALFLFMLVYLSFDDLLLIMDDITEEIPYTEEIFSGGKRFFLTGSLLYSISLAGAIQMWKLNKLGFHLYAVAQIFILILPVVMIKSNPIPLLGIAITGAFIYGYYTNLKYMS